MNAKERLEKLKESRQAAQALNKKALVKENTKQKSNPRLEQKQERKRQEAEKLLQVEQLESQGVDATRVNNTLYTIEDVEKWEEKQVEKQNNITNGFTDYHQSAAKSYRKMISEFNPNLRAYREQKTQEDVYKGAHSVDYADPDKKASSAALERLSQDIDNQRFKRQNYSRRRKYDEDADVYRVLIVGHLLMSVT